MALCAHSISRSPSALFFGSLPLGSGLRLLLRREEETRRQRRAHGLTPAGARVHAKQHVHRCGQREHARTVHRLGRAAQRGVLCERYPRRRDAERGGATERGVLDHSPVHETADHVRLLRLERRLQHLLRVRGEIDDACTQRRGEEAPATSATTRVAARLLSQSGRSLRRRAAPPATARARRRPVSTPPGTSAARRGASQTAPAPAD
mmetsp:Transcript_14831/g.47970  ORF Transcript_14831/g.47970 Transcript_14831/m.47970 type:complete len:207 (-) Transcript_14831:11-631(-)